MIENSYKLAGHMLFDLSLLLTNYVTFDTIFPSYIIYYIQRDAAALNARESMAFADVTQLGDQLNMHMPESIASIFQHQSIPGTAGTAVGGHGGRVGGEGRHLDKPPSPVSIPRAQISKGKINGLMT